MLGLVGENGSGKSTTMNILGGVLAPDSGRMTLDGRAYAPATPGAASAAGIAFIHQELNLVPKFNALQNLLLGLPKPQRAGVLDWRAARRQVEPTLKRLGIDFPMDVPVADLTVAERWLISIARALLHRARLIAMDEPTASLSAEESVRLFSIVRELSAEGIAILYVSHRLDEILDLCSRVTVFKDGALVASLPRADLNKAALVRSIVGGDLGQMDAVSHAPPDRPVLLEVRGLSRRHHVRGASFTLHEGEVLGLAGLVGAGRSELVRMIYGADRPDAGEILLRGRPVAIRSPYDAVRQGIVLVPEERRSQGLLLDKSVAFNVNIPRVSSLRRVSWLPLISLGRANTRAQEIVQKLQVKTRSVDTPVRNLSGGNQQKVVIGKWLTESVKVIILDEPLAAWTWAQADIHAIVRSLAAEGAGVIVISSEVEELPGLCDRVLVMRRGEIAGSFERGEFDREKIMAPANNARAEEPRMKRSLALMPLPAAPLPFAALIVIGFSLANDRYLSLANFRNILSQAAQIAIIAIGMTFVLLIADIDLAVGADIYLSAILLNVFMPWLPAAAALPVIAVIGALFGTINATFIAGLRVAAFITTLATLFIGRGIALYLSGNKMASPGEAVLTFGRCARAGSAGTGVDFRGRRCSVASLPGPAPRLDARSMPLAPTRKPPAKRASTRA